MPWSDIEKRRAYRRRRYAETGREWGTMPAICPVCSKERMVSKNSSLITTLPKDDAGRVIKRCRACSKRKDYAPWMDKEFVTDYQAKKRRELKVRAITHMGGKCIDCGLAYNGTNGYAFDFDHRDGSGKEFAIASKSYSWPRVLVELVKCDLRCVICHRKRHSEPY